MKISKKLLTAVAVGVALGTTTTSCSMFTDQVEVEPQEKAVEGKDNGGEDPYRCNCPGCGMG